MKLRKYLFPVIFLAAMTSILFAQASHDIDFEPAGVGADWEWVVAENGSNPPLEFVANPNASGINTSATVAKFTALQTGNPWALFFTDDDGQFTFDASNIIVKIMVHKTEISPVNIKFEGGTGVPLELSATNTVINQWEELTYDFTDRIGSTFSRMVIIPDLQPRAQDNIVYIDNIEVPDGVVITLPEPTVAAPVPTNPANEVMSVFSDAYTNITGTDFNPNWGQATQVSQFVVQGDTTLLYETLNYQGTQFASPLDVSSMTYMHVDFWTPNSTDLGIYLINEGIQEVKYLLIPPGATETWVSVDIPLSAFAPIDLTNVGQLKVDGNGTIYFDNIYFHQGSSIPTEPTVAAPTPMYPQSQVISLFSNAYTNVPVDTWSADWDNADVTDVQVDGNDTKLYTNMVFAGIEFISQTVDATSMTNFHMDIWTPDATALPAVFRIKLVDFGADGAFGGGDDVEHELTFDANSTPALATAEWVSFDIPLSDFVGLTTLGHLAQLVISGDPNTVYVDNVYFHTGIVPVELTSFTASIVDGSALLEWTTATETNNSGFAVEKSTNNQNFAQIAFVDGKGTTTEVTNYTYVDSDLSASTAYYRLKQIDFDGTSTYSNTVEVNNALPTSFALEQNFPNPFNPTTNIKFSLPEAQNVSLKVFNMLGQEVVTLVNEFRNAGVYEVSFNANNLPTGTYFYSITAGEFTSVKKMLLIK